MLDKLIALLRNRSHGKDEVRIVEALRNEARSERRHDLDNPESEEGVQEVMRLIASEPRPAQATSSSTPRSFLVPALGALSVVAVILFIFNGPRNQGQLIDEIDEQARTLAPPQPEEFSVELPAIPSAEKSIHALRQAAQSFPLVVEATRLKQDAQRKADSFLTVAQSWGDFATPDLPIPTLPELPQTPYQSELDNLRQDALRALEFLGETFAPFNS